MTELGLLTDAQGNRWLRDTPDFNRVWNGWDFKT